MTKRIKIIKVVTPINEYIPSVSVHMPLYTDLTDWEEITDEQYNYLMSEDGRIFLRDLHIENNSFYRDGHIVILEDTPVKQKVWVEKLQKEIEKGIRISERRKAEEEEQRAKNIEIARKRKITRLKNEKIKREKEIQKAKELLSREGYM